MKKHRLIIIVALAVLCVAAWPVGRGALRYRLINRFFETPDAYYLRQRLRIFPGEKQIPVFADEARRVSLGYARFDLGTGGKAWLASFGDGTYVALTNDVVRMHFWRPFPKETFGRGSEDLDQVIRKANRTYRQVVKRVQRMKTSPVDAETEVEQTIPALPWQMVTMGNDEFLLYALSVAKKISCEWGYNEVFHFLAPHTKGLVRIGVDANDRRQALVMLTSHDDERNVWFSVKLPGDARPAIDEVLLPVLGSFRFVAASLTDTNEVAKMITEAGIARGQSGHSWNDVNLQ